MIGKKAVERLGALRPGELYIIETLRDHLENSNVPNRNVGERASSRYTLPDFSQQVAPKILRGIFKPRSKESPKGIHSLVMRHAGHASLLMDRVPSRRDKSDGSDPHKGGQGMPQTL